MEDKRERQLERLRNWYKNLSEEKKEERRAYQREYRRKLREAMPDGVRETKRLWRIRNRGRVNQQQRERYAAHPERWQGYREKLDPDKVRAEVRASYRRNHKEITWRRFQRVMSRQEFEEIYLRTLSGTCELCGDLPRTGKALCIDHDHTTGRFRGVLCIECNFAIAKAETKPLLRERYADYLNRINGVKPG